MGQYECVNSVGTYDEVRYFPRDLVKFPSQRPIPQPMYLEGTLVRIIDEGEPDITEWALMIVVGLRISHNRWRYFLAPDDRKFIGRFWVKENDIQPELELVEL